MIFVTFLFFFFFLFPLIWSVWEKHPNGNIWDEKILMENFKQKHLNYYPNWRFDVNIPNRTFEQKYLNMRLEVAI